MPALSINWGPWADAGMAAGVSKERFASQGITNIEPERGMQILNTLLAQEFTQPCVIEVDWRKYAESRDINVVRDFFSPVIGQTQTRQEEAVAKEEQTSILNELQECPAAQRKTVLLTFLKQTALDVLGYSESEPIETEEALVNQGFDSLMSVEMRNRLGKSLNQTLPASLLFDYPTLDKIAGYLLENIVVIHDEESAAQESTVNESAPDDLLNEIDDLVKS
ncbi:hypothetical protein GF373_12040 [bacterium]|nr:hypothetical protein [bacterium]